MRTDQYYQPAFALPKDTYTAAQVAEIVSHEVGHTLGLSHDGLGASAYYQDSTGTKIWSPIMGAGYTPLTQFSNGDYIGATQTQDDFAVIGQNGPTLLSDDYGDSRGGVLRARRGRRHRRRAGRRAGPTSTSSPSTRSCAGTLSASVSPAAARAGPRHPAPAARRLGRGGRRLGAADRARRHLVAGADRHGRSGLTSRLPAGTYYLEVDGTGLSDPVLGYSDYGSVGRYTLSVTGCPGTVHAATAPSPPVIVAAERDSAAHGLRLVWDDPGSDGGAAVTSYVVSAGGQTVTVPATTHAYTFGGLAPSTTYTLSVAAVNSVGTSPAASRPATTGVFSGTPSPTATPSPTSTPTSSSDVQPDAHADGHADPPPTSSPTADTHQHRPRASRPATPTADADRAAHHVVRRPGGTGGALGPARPRRRPLTLRVAWQQPASTGGAPLTGYVVAVWKAKQNGKAARYGTVLVEPRRTAWLKLPAGRYRFAVAAENFAGTGPRSARTPADGSAVGLAQHQPGVVHAERDLDPVADAELVEQPRHVGLDGRHREVELGGDLGVAEPAADGEGDLALAVGQVGQAGDGLGGPAGAGHLTDQRPGHRRGEHRVALRDLADRVDDLRRRGVLEQEPVGAGGERLDDVLVGVEGRQHDHPRRVVERPAARRVASRPLSRGIRMSISTTSGRSSSARATPSRPSPASPTTSRSGWPPSMNVSAERTSGSSSTMRSRVVSHQAAHGIQPRSTNCCPSRRPSSRPPRSSARSASPIRPSPEPGVRGGPEAERVAQHDVDALRGRPGDLDPDARRRGRACRRW